MNSWRPTSSTTSSIERGFLYADPKSLIALECQEERIFWCKLAQSKSKFALVIEHPIDKKKELVADLIAPPTTRQAQNS